MSQYNPQQFINAISSKIGNKKLQCPICGNMHFTSTSDFTSLLINNEFNGIKIGPTIPAGMLICTKCGHIELFALGVLGLIEKVDEKTDGKTENAQE